jgi:peroxiredoxin
MTRAPLLTLALGLATCAGCAAPAPARLPDVALASSDGAPLRLAELTARAPLTVVVFFSAGCPIQRAHDARLVALAARYRPRGVQLVAVDSEATATPASDRDEAQRRGYPFPILTDPDGRVADALGAEVATHTVVLDAAGRARYRGGLDSDRARLHDDAALYLRDALDRLLEGREPERVETVAPGCMLRRR